MKSDQRAPPLPGRGSRATQQAATASAYLLGAAAIIGYLHGCYSTLGWGPAIIVPNTSWLFIRASLLAGLAGALIATLLALRQHIGRLLALIALVGTILLLLLSAAYISSFPAVS